MMLELECPVCGALILGADEAELIGLAGEHTLMAHAYRVPDDHVRTRMHVVDDSRRDD